MHTRFLSLTIHNVCFDDLQIKVDVNHGVEEEVLCFWGCSSFTRKWSRRDDAR
jgi:hypothetical protein